MARLPGDRNVIEPVTHLPVTPLLLRYAAIEWQWKAVRAASCGIELTRVFDVIEACVPELEPDPEAAKTRRAPELVRNWPRADERALVWIVGHQIARDVLGTRRIQEPLRSIVSRCTARDPDARFQRLRELFRALRDCVERGYEHHTVP